ncbi:MAG: hypothetical protein ACOVOG_07185 [Rubrivivax sp.]|jgi:hypothetical protein|nr:hypothetical protein [Rubrivivax sp.]
MPMKPTWSLRAALHGAVLTAAAAVAGPASAQQVQIQCPASIVGQYSRLGAYAVDGPKSSIDGWSPQFDDRSTMRLVSPRIAIAHGGEALPSESPPPDQLTFVLGKPMKWTLWDGRPPEPQGVVHVVCEYEGGLLLHRALGRTVQHCTLQSASAKPNAKNGLLREVATRAIFTCR